MAKSPGENTENNVSENKQALESLPPGHLVVRMYRQGLGDCFLLAFGGRKVNRSQERTRFVLIDCGVHSRQNSGPDRLRQVMEDIVDATGGYLDVVVATHEHADHLSGFIQKGSPFLDKRLKVGQLWVGWTEQAGDPQADILRARRATARSVIDKVLKDMLDEQGVQLAPRIQRFTQFEQHTPGEVDESAIKRLIHQRRRSQSDPTASTMVESFLDPPAASSSSQGIAAASHGRRKPSKNELALALLSASAENGVQFCEAGTFRTVPGVDNLRAHVLGPPRDERLLKKDKPSKIRRSNRDQWPEEHGEYKEVYLSANAGDRAFLYAPALGNRLPFDVAPDFPPEMRSPFHAIHRRTITEPASRHKGEKIEHTVTSTLFRKTYLKPGSEWRKIENDWLEATEQLAMNLDSDTNNTSLVLAFEWGDPGKGQVLLFTGDAQVGNWLSWRRQTYNAGKKTMTADELLRRVVLYKVGHHASHNATGRRDSSETTEKYPLGVPFGLELMDDIIALIPVDRTAAQKNRPWEMPHAPLYRRLREKANRRVLRSDNSTAPLESADEPDLVPGSAGWGATPGLKNVRWRAADRKFNDDPKIALYYDIEIPLDEDPS